MPRAHHDSQGPGPLSPPVSAGTELDLSGVLLCKGKVRDLSSLGPQPQALCKCSVIPDLTVPSLLLAVGAFPCHRAPSISPVLMHTCLTTHVVRGWQSEDLAGSPQGRLPLFLLGVWMPEAR